MRLGLGVMVAASVAAGIGVATSVGGQATPAPTAVCRAQAPADLSAGPAHWLGGCAKGRAHALGVLRVGARAPYQFFLGRMNAGRPETGVLVLNDSQLMEARRFDAKLNAVPSDGLTPGQIEQTFRTASAGAAAVAQRYQKSGNAASAAFYRRMAEKYREPPFE